MPFSSSWSLMKCIANKQTLPYWKLGVDGIMRIANMCSLPMVFFLIQILNKRALLSRNEICRKYALFRIFFDSDLTQTIAIWLRLYSDICPKKWWLEPLLRQSFCGKFKLSAEFCNCKNRLLGFMTKGWNRGSNEGRISAKAPNFCVFWVSMAEFGRNSAPF